MPKSNPGIQQEIEALDVPDHDIANCPQATSRQAKSRKRRQSACATRHDVIASYKRDVSSVWVNRPTKYDVWFNPEGLILNCKSIDPNKLPTGFVRVGDERYQYNLTDPELSSKSKRYRPVAYRVPFISTLGYYDKTMSVSHLCHNNWCYNWDHHVLEPLEVNKARNGCSAGPTCRHKTKCLIPGKYSEC